MRPLIIDCDTGRDDALTLWLAVLKNLPLAGVVASYGNVALDKVVDNCARVLSLAGAGQVPLFAGADAPSRQHRLVESVVLARHKSSGNGLCNLTFPAGLAHAATQDIAATAKALAAIAAERGPLDYFIIGPATNFAALMRIWGAALPNIIASVTMLGGKLPPLWTEVPGADFNVACDPFAVAAMLNCGLPVRIVPLNATWPILMPLDHIERLSPRTTLAQWAKDLMIAHCRHFAPEPLFRFHDPSVLIAAAKPSLFRQTKLSIVTDEADEDFGRMVESVDGHACGLCATGPSDHDAFRNDILRSLEFDGV